MKGYQGGSRLLMFAACLFLESLLCFGSVILLLDGEIYLLAFP